MCEPYHSIVQYPNDFPDDNLPFGDNIPKESRLSLLGKFAKKIGRFFHISRMGAGHSLAVGHINSSQFQYLPSGVNYEGAWWDKELKLDVYPCREAEPEPFNAALEYFDRVCIGNIKAFRRFLECSMESTQRRPDVYSDRFLRMLNVEGQQRLRGKINNLGTRRRSSFIKTVMGFTRKRELWLPNWADDNTFWS